MRMFRALTVWSAMVVILGGSAALAQEPPPLEAPAAEAQANQPSPPPSQPKPTASAPAASPSPAQSQPSRTSTGPSQIRPLLIIPGVTAPPQPGAVRPKTDLPNTASPPAVIGPANGDPRASMTGAPEAGSPFQLRVGGPSQGQPAPGAGPQPPITLEPIEDEPEGRPRNSLLPDARSDRGMPGPGPSTPSRPADRSATTNQPLWRPPGVLGRLFGLPPQPAPRSAPSGDQARRRSEPHDATIDAQADAASDAKTKRRIEKQIYEALGDRLRSVEVRVTGRNVLIVARPNRFWQKRGIRRTLEALPTLDGYRARIDVAD